MRAAPAISCATCTESARMSIQGSGEHPTFPAQWLYGLSRALPGEPCTVATVDANIGASGPHVFAVRFGRARQSQPPRPPQPAPRRDDGRRPLWVGRDGYGYSPVRTSVKAKYFLFWGLTFHFRKSEVICPSGRFVARCRDSPSPLVGEGGFAKRRR